MRRFWRASRLEHGADFPIAYSVIRESEGAGFSHFPRSAKKSTKGCAGKRAANADAFNPQFGKRCKAQLNALQPRGLVVSTE